MAIYVLSTIFQPYHFVGFQIDFEGYGKVRSVNCEVGTVKSEQ